MKRNARSKPFSVVTVGNVTVKIYRRFRDKRKPTKRAIFEVADYTTGVRRLRGFGGEGDARKEAEKIPLDQVYESYTRELCEDVDPMPDYERFQD